MKNRFYLYKKMARECSDKDCGPESMDRVISFGSKLLTSFIAVLVYYDYYLFTQGFGFSSAQFLQYLYSVNPFTSSYLALFLLFYAMAAVSFFVAIFFVDRVAFSIVRYIESKLGNGEIISYVLMLFTIIFIFSAFRLLPEYCLLISYFLSQLYFSMMLYMYWERNKPCFFVRLIFPVIVLMAIIVANGLSTNFAIAYFYIMVLLWLIGGLFFELSKPQQVETGDRGTGVILYLFAYLILLGFLIFLHSQNIKSWTDVEKNDFSFNLLLNRMFLSPISYDSSVIICVEPNMQKALSGAMDLIELKDYDSHCCGSAIDSANFKNGRYLPIGTRTFLYISQDKEKALYMIVEKREKRFEQRYYLAAVSLKPLKQ